MRLDQDSGRGSVPGFDEEPMDWLVEACLAAVEDRGASALDEMCAAHPEYASGLRLAVRRSVAAAPATEPPTGTRPVAGAESLAGPGRAEHGFLRLGRLRLIEWLGAGSTGVVYMGEDPDLGRRVAVKLLQPDLLSAAGALERFRRDLSLAARFEHPGIVPVHSVGNEEGVPFYTRELLRGAKLADLLETLAGRSPASLVGADLADALSAARLGDRVSADEVGGAIFEGTWTDACLRIAHQLARALEYAHERGVAHLNVDATNVVVLPSGRAQLCDFGLPAGSGQAPASPAPLEWGLSDPETDTRSLGLLLIELLTLSRPFSSASDDSRHANRADAVPDLLRANPRIPHDAVTVLKRTLEREPSRRFAAIEDLARDLELVIDGRPLAHRVPAIRVGEALDSLPAETAREAEPQGEVETLDEALRELTFERDEQLASPSTARRPVALPEREALPSSVGYEVAPEPRRGLVGWLSSHPILTAGALIAAIWGGTELWSRRAQGDVASRRDPSLGPVADSAVRGASIEGLVEPAEALTASRATDSEPSRALEPAAGTSSDSAPAGPQPEPRLDPAEEPVAAVAGKNEAAQALAAGALAGAEPVAEPVVEAGAEAGAEPAADGDGLLPEDALANDAAGASEVAVRSSLGWIAGLFAVPEDGSELLAREVLDRGAREFETVELPTSLRAELSSFLGGSYQNLGRVEDAEPHLARALELARAEYGTSDARVSGFALPLGRLWIEEGRWDAARELYSTLLADRRDQLGPEDAELVVALENVANHLIETSRLDEADALLTSTLAAARTALGSDDLDTLHLLNNLANVRDRLGHYAEAEPLYREALDLIQARYGERHEYFVYTAGNLATLYDSLGRTSDAEPLYETALARSLEVFGQGHASTFVCRDNLAAFYESQGRHPEAGALYESMLADWNGLLGNEDEATLITVFNLGNSYLAQGRYDEAESLLADAFQNLQYVFGDADPRTLGALRSLIGVYEKLERFGEAESLAKVLLARTPADDPAYAGRAELLTLIQSLSQQSH